LEVSERRIVLVIEDDDVIITISVGSMKFGKGVGVAKATWADRPMVVMKAPTVPIILQQLVATLRFCILSSKVNSFVAPFDDKARRLECLDTHLEVGVNTVGEGQRENALAECGEHTSSVNSEIIEIAMAEKRRVGMEEARILLLLYCVVLDGSQYRLVN